MPNDSRRAARSHLADAGLDVLPDGWDVAELGDLLSQDRGISVGVMYPGDDVSDGVPLIKAGDLNGSVINPHPEFRISKEKHHEYRRTELQGGELLMTLVGNVGQCAVVPQRMAGWNTARAVAVMRLADPSDAHYVQQCLLSRPLQHLIDVWCNTTVQATLNLKEIRQLPLPWPPKSLRDAIAAFGKALDDKIELNRLMNATLEAMARALFQSWFVDFDPVRAELDGREPPGLDRATAALFPNEYEDSELGQIPKGWKIGTLGTLFGAKSDCVLTGPFGSNLHASDYSKEGVPLILVKHVIDGRIIEDRLPLVGANKVAELTRYRLKLGDIVFTRVGAVGRTAYVHARNIGWLISGQTLRVRVPDWEILHPRYLAQVYLDPAFVAMVEGHSLGTTRPSLNTGLLRDFRFLVPPSMLTNRFAEIVTSFDEQRQHVDAQSRTLAMLRDTLLPKLLSGELKFAR